MKIAILGYSGSGKSTLAQKLGKKLELPILHLDAVHHLPGWKEREREDEQEIVRAFLDEHDAWIIDGNYSKLLLERRLEEADRIYLLLLNRFACLRRVTVRYLRYRGVSRPDMAEGCSEKLDAAFVWWVLWNGRRPHRKKIYHEAAQKYPNKLTIVRSQRSLDRLYRELGL